MTSASALDSGRPQSTPPGAAWARAPTGESSVARTAPTITGTNLRSSIGVHPSCVVRLVVERATVHQGRYAGM